MIHGKRADVKHDKKGGKWLGLLVLMVGAYLVWTLAKGALELRLAYKRIDQARSILVAEESKASELKKKWAEVQTSEYIEKVARDDLNMQKEGETVVVLPKMESRGSENAGVQETEKEVPNWRRWWNLVK